MHTIMKITLRERTAETTAIYFRKASTPQIRRTLPQKAKTLAEALEDYKATLLPGAASYGRTIWPTAYMSGTSGAMGSNLTVFRMP